MNRYGQSLSIPPLNRPPQRSSDLGPLAVALSFTVILAQVQADALLPVLVAALLMLAGVMRPSRG